MPQTSGLFGTSPMTSPFGGIGRFAGTAGPGLGSVGESFQGSAELQDELQGSSQQDPTRQNQTQLELMLLIEMLLAQLMEAQRAAQNGEPQAAQQVQDLTQRLQALEGQAGGASPLGGPGSGGGYAPSASGSGGGGSSPSGASGGSAPTADNFDASNVSADGPINDPKGFAVNLLKSLGDPVTDANVNSIVAWEKREGGHWNNSAHYNPLNTTQREAGSSSMNSVGVQSYNSWDQGLQATVKTLHNGYYNDILGALKSGQGLSGHSYAGLGKWSGGGYTSV
jgi:hypothetical protein